MMRNKNYKVQAFTILEVTISMLVAAVVIAITYTTYSIVSKSYLSFKTKNERMAVLANLDHLLAKDFDKADLITTEGNSLVFNSATNLSVTYTFTDSYVTRNSGIVDTFKISPQNLQVWFEGVPINIIDQYAEKDKTQNIDVVKFDVNFQGDSIAYHFYKNYSSVNLFNTKPDAVN